MRQPIARAPTASHAPAARGTGRQVGSSPARTAGGGPAVTAAELPSWLVSASHRWLGPLSRLVTWMVFGRVIVHRRLRFPRHGAVLVCANHPAMWTDALVLETALRRPLHFLALATLFERGARRWFLRGIGALPIHHRDDTPAAQERNAETTGAVHHAFRRRDVVVTFPEGVSAGDWRIAPFKPGAAWLALEADAPVVIPVGLHYRERTAWRGDVEVSIGAPLDPAPYRREPDRVRAVHALTHHLSAAVRALAVDAADAEIEDASRGLLPLVVPARDRGQGTVGVARRLVRRLEALRAQDPGRFVDLCRRARHYRRMRARIGLDDVAIRGAGGGHPALRTLVRDAPAGLLGAVAALAGWAIHWLPRRITEIAARRFTPEPTRIAFGRAVAGLAIFPFAYVLAAWVMLRLARWPHARVWSLLAIAATLGIISLACRRWVARLGLRLRAGWLARRAPRQLARVRAVRAAVLERMP